MSREAKGRRSPTDDIDQLAAGVGWHDLDCPALFRDSAIDEIDRYAEAMGRHGLDPSELAEGCDAPDGPEPDFLDEAADEMVGILDGYLIAMKAAP